MIHWEVDLNPNKALVGHFGRFFIDSLTYMFLSKMASIMGHRENILEFDIFLGLLYILYIRD